VIGIAAQNDLSTHRQTQRETAPLWIIVSVEIGEVRSGDLVVLRVVSTCGQQRGQLFEPLRFALPMASELPHGSGRQRLVGMQFSARNRKARAERSRQAHCVSSVVQPTHLQFALVLLEPPLVRSWRIAARRLSISRFSGLMKGMGRFQIRTGCRATQADGAALAAQLVRVVPC
jgi:hypothetical protein